MFQIFQQYRGDIIIIGILAIEIIILLALGINTLKKSRSLANRYFSAVFFITVAYSAVNIAVRILSIQIEILSEGAGPSETLKLIYLLSISLVTAAMAITPITYGAGFYIINFGERFYREKKGTLVFVILTLLVGGIIIASLFWPTYQFGFKFVSDPNIIGYEEYFNITPPLAYFLFAISFIFIALDIILLIRIFPDTENKAQKRKIISLMLVVGTYFLGLVNLIVVDMQLFTEPETDVFNPSWNYIYITSFLFIFSVILLYFSIVKRKKTES